jgi:hypothetical protein
MARSARRRAPLDCEALTERVREFVTLVVPLTEPERDLVPEPLREELPVTERVRVFVTVAVVLTVPVMEAEGERLYEDVADIEGVGGGPADFEAD